MIKLTLDRRKNIKVEYYETKQEANVSPALPVRRQLSQKRSAKQCTYPYKATEKYDEILGEPEYVKKKQIESRTSFLCLICL